MPSLREQQLRFAEALLGPADAVPALALAGGADPVARIAIYRNNVFSNYRNALGASYPVVCRLVGKAFFDAAVDAFVGARPSTAGDLNVYGADFGDFLADYPYAQDLPYLPDVARLEWAIDEVQRAPDRDHSPQRVLEELAAIAPERLAAVGFELDPACRLLASPFPVLQIWRVNQPDYEGDGHVDLDAGADRLLVRSEHGLAVIERLDRGLHDWLHALHERQPLGEALDLAQRAHPAFDLAAALSAHIQAGTLARIAVRDVR